jgi:transposase
MLPVTTIVAVARAMSTGGKLVVLRIPHDRAVHSSIAEEDVMQVVHARCCGLDVHKKSVVACVLLTESDGTVRRQVRTFGTMTADLLVLDDWLTGHGVTQIAMESTGVYWRPVFNLLEGEERTVTLVNAQHLKAVPGHKTDVKDSEWLADLLRHGLVKASFIPPAPIRELRELTRARKTLVQQRADAVNRVHKLLEGANIKLASVATGSPRILVVTVDGGW